MKKHIKTIAGLLFALTLVISFCACFSPWAASEDTGITLSFDGDGRQITKWPPPGAEQRDIEYTIDITDSSTGTPIPTINHRGGGTVFIKLEPGFYDVDILAEHSMAPCAEFHSLTPIEVKANKNKPVRIEMSPVSTLSFTVMFNANGGNPTPGSVTLALNSLITEPTGLTNGSYILVGWYKESTFNTKWNFTTDRVTGNMTLHAKWSIGYPINYNMGSGGTPGNPAIYTVEDLPITLNDASGNPGYTFAGWYDNSGFTGSAVTTIPVGTASAVNLWAKWEGITYYVHYNANGGTGTMSDSTHVYGTSSNLTANAFTAPTGATFAGWATLPGGAVAYGEGDPVLTLTTTPEDTVQLHARWQYTVDFDTNGGTPSTYPSVSVLAGNSISGPGGTPTRTWTLPEGLYSGSAISTSGNYSISSWSVGSPGGTTFTFGTTTVNGNITLYTNWSGGPPTPLETTITNAVSYVNSTAGAYTYWFTGGSISLSPQTLSNSGTSLYLQGSSATTIALSTTGSLFDITGGNLYLNANIILNGYNGNNAPLVKITNGTLSMTGSTIQNNIRNLSAGKGTGVCVDSGGTFNMNSGSLITGNKGHDGVGVYVEGTFNLNGGTISNNVDSIMGAINGGGVMVNNGGQFTMTSGNIINNSVSSAGGGVAIDGATSEFKMNGGTISGNTAQFGGGVAVKLYFGGIFNKTAGTINSNTATGITAGIANGNSVAVFYPWPNDYINGTVGASDSIGWNNGTLSGTLWND